MGYESKIFIVKKTSIKDDETGKFYAENLASVDLSKCYLFSDKFRHFPKTDCYFYSEDGDKRITEDWYGAELTEGSISDALIVLEAAMETDNNWRLKILKGTLEAFIEFDAPDLAVLHFGY